MIKNRAFSLVVALILLVPCMSFALPGPHDPTTGGYPFTCNSCHIAPASFGDTPTNFTNNVCTRCHKSLDPNTGKAFLPEDFADIENTNSALRGAPVNTSHKWLGTAINPKVKAVAPVDNIGVSVNPQGLNKPMIKGAGTGTLSCVRCHSVHGTSGIASNNTPYLRYVNDKDQLCMNCHRDRDTITAAVGSHPVNITYSSASVKSRASEFKLVNNEPYKNSTNASAEIKNKNGVVVCSSCHKIHTADSNSATFDSYTSALVPADGSLLRVSKRGADNAVDTINVCTNCHTKKHTSQLNQHTKSANIQCMDCHNAHVDVIDAADPVQTPNKYLLRRYVNYSGVKNNVTQLGTYRKRLVYTTDVATAKWSAADGTGVCQACHALPSSVSEHTNYTKTRNDCVACHANAPHTDTQPIGGCTGCHGTPPISLATTASGTFAYPGDEATAPHSTHASGGAGNYSFSCVQCHNGAAGSGSAHNSAPSNYNDGVFFTKVPVTAGGVIAGPAPVYNGTTCTAVYCHSDGTSTTALGSPQTVTWANGINLNPTCASCHAASPTTGTHTYHITTLASKGYGCVTCHSATVSNNTTVNVAGGKHVNALKDISFSDIGLGAGLATKVSGTSCSAVYCHSNGKGTYSPVAPTWGGTAACGSCHATAANGSLATGSHAGHFTTIGTGDSSCTSCHTYTGAISAGHVNGTVDVTAGCATNSCHGTITAPTWGANTTNATCTKCHGTGTASVSVANREVVAPSLPAGTDTGNVSANAKTGAHQAHILMPNGLSSVGTKDVRCQNCHGALPGSGTHANGSSAPAFEGLAKPAGFTSSFTPGASPTCSVYCHNPAATGGTLNAANVGTGVTPAWNDPAYIANAPLKTVNNCNKCHKSPWDSGFTSSYTHGAMTPATDCIGCHGHDGNTLGSAGQQHMDGIKYGSGSCDTCHGYPPVTNQAGMRGVVGNYENAKTEDYANGGGHHTGHLLATVVQTDGWTPCLPCHPSGFHNQGGGTVARANVQVNDAADAGYRFDSSRSKRYNTATLSCSNVSCHFQPTPAW